MLSPRIGFILLSHTQVDFKHGSFTFSIRGCDTLYFIGKAFFEGAGDGNKSSILALVTGKFCVPHGVFLIDLNGFKRFSVPQKHPTDTLKIGSPI